MLKNQSKFYIDLWLAIQNWIEFHIYSILTGIKIVEFLIYCVLIYLLIFRSILPSFTKKKRRRDSGSDEDPQFREEKEDEDLLSDRRRSGRGKGII